MRARVEKVDVLGWNKSYIQFQTWSQVTEVYLSQLGPKTHVFPTLATGYNLVPNGKQGGSFQWKYTGTLKHWPRRRHSCVT